MGDFIPALVMRIDWSALYMRLTTGGRLRNTMPGNVHRVVEILGIFLRRSVLFVWRPVLSVMSFLKSLLRCVAIDVSVAVAGAEGDRCYTSLTTKRGFGPCFPLLGS